MATVTKTFSAVGVSDTLKVRKGDHFDYDLTGSFTATLILEKSKDQQGWEPVVDNLTAAASDRVQAAFKDADSVYYRFRCYAYTSGSPVITMSDVVTTHEEKLDAEDEVVYKIDDEGFKFVKPAVTSSGVGAVAGSGATVVEYGNGVIHKSVITLDSLQVDVTSVTTGAGVGGTKIYDFPEGYIHVLGCTADLSIAVLTEADFTDGTPEGDVGIGTVAPANADALGTDATDDDIATATPFTMSAYAATVDLPPDGSVFLDGTSTAKDVYLNAYVDAADIDDDTTGELLFSGTVTIVWVNCGDY